MRSTRRCCTEATFRSIALVAGASLFLLGIAALGLGYPGQYPAKAFLGQSVRAILLRSFVPLSIAVVLVEGFLFTMGIRNNLNPAILASIVALCSAIGIGIFVEIYSRRISGQIERADWARSEALASLELANKKLGILGRISRHDLLNQITLLSGWMELARGSCKDELTMNALEKASLALKSTQSQIDFMVIYETIGVEHPEWLDLKRQIMDGSRDLDLSRVHLSVDAEKMEVYADRMLSKVFRNLVNNSLQHGGHVSTIAIRAEAEGDSLRITYEDDGDGISAEDKSQLFKQGFGKHTGYGLYLSREILSITHIGITETGIPGKGARFEMIVPQWRHQRPQA